MALYTWEMRSNFEAQPKSSAIYLKITADLMERATVDKKFRTNLLPKLLPRARPLAGALALRLQDTN
jgi:hypothetical protein